MEKIKIKNIFYIVASIVFLNAILISCSNEKSESIKTVEKILNENPKYKGFSVVIQEKNNLKRDIYYLSEENKKNPQSVLGFDFDNDGVNELIAMIRKDKEFDFVIINQKKSKIVSLINDFVEEEDRFEAESIIKDIDNKNMLDWGDVKNVNPCDCFSKNISALIINHPINNNAYVISYYNNNYHLCYATC